MKKLWIQVKDQTVAEIAIFQRNSFAGGTTLNVVYLRSPTKDEVYSWARGKLELYCVKDVSSGDDTAPFTLYMDEAGTLLPRHGAERQKYGLATID